MALSSSAQSSNYLGSIHEIEELEIMEVDEALLWNLLEETNEERGEDDVNCSFQSLDVNNCNSTSKINEHDLEVDDLDWHEMMNAIPSLAADEIMVWYIDDMVQMIDYAYAGDYSQFYNGDSSDEANYCSLWQE